MNTDSEKTGFELRDYSRTDLEFMSIGVKGFSPSVRIRVLPWLKTKFMADQNQQHPNQPPAQSNPERKTLDDRRKMNELERIRHSCAHIMATAIN
jgi:hypothetical protein